MQKIKKRQSNGFTLLELLLYTSLLVGTVIVLSSFYIGVERFRVNNESVRFVEEESHLVMSEVKGVISEARAVLSPAPGEKTNKLILEFEDQSRNPTIISAEDNRISIQEGDGLLEPLTSLRIITDSEELVFEYLQADSLDPNRSYFFDTQFISVEFTLENVSPEITTGFVPNYKKTFRTSVELEKRQALDSLIRHGLLLWLDAADFSTLTLNDGRIIEWRDKSNQGHRAVQSEADQRPLYVPNVEGRPANLFSDFEQYLTIAPHTDFDISSVEDSLSVFLWIRNDGICDSSNTTYGDEVFISRRGSNSSTESWRLGCTGPAEGDPNRLNLHFFTETSTFTNPRSDEFINDIEWRHVGWMYDGATQEISLYMNGEILETLTVESPSAVISANPLCLGGYGDDCDGYRGHHLMGDVRMYNRILSEEEIKHLYLTGKKFRGWSLE